MFKRFFSEERGGSTVEFVIMFPVLIGVVFAGIESGWLMTRFMMVERGVDVAMRSVRLGNVEDPTYDKLITSICNVAYIIDDCEQNLVVTTQVVDEEDPADTVITTPAPCFDRTLSEEELDEYDPSTGHNTGGQTEIIVVKVCAVVDPIMGNIDFSRLLPRDVSGGYHIRTTSAFLNEPT